MYCPLINVKPSYYPALTKENKSSPSSPLPPVPSPANWLPCWGWILSKRVCVTTCKSLSKICDLDMEMKVCGVLSAARLGFLICLIWLASRTKSVKSLPITSVFVACRESCPCFSYACETCSCFKVILWELFMSFRRGSQSTTIQCEISVEQPRCWNRPMETELSVQHSMVEKMETPVWLAIGLPFIRPAFV